MPFALIDAPPANVIAEVEAEHGHVFHQQYVGGNLLDPAARETYHQDPSTVRDTAQRKIKGVAADRIEHQVGAIRQPRANIIQRRVRRKQDGIVSAMLACNRELLQCRSSRNNGRADRFGELDRRQADRAGRTMNQHRFAWPQLRTPRQRGVGCAVGQWNLRRDIERKVVRKAVNRGRIGNRVSA